MIYDNSTKFENTTKMFISFALSTSHVCGKDYSETFFFNYLHLPEANNENEFYRKRMSKININHSV